MAWAAGRGIFGPPVTADAPKFRTAADVRLLAKVAVTRARLRLSALTGRVPVVTYATYRTASSSTHWALRRALGIRAIKAHALFPGRLGWHASTAMRADLPDAAKSDVLSRFLGFPGIEVRCENRSEDHGLAGLSATVHRAIRLRPDAVRGLLDGRMARHFWTEAQRGAMLAKWLG